MDLEEFIKLLNDMMLLYGNKTLLTVTDSRNEYKIVSVTGNQCAKYFEPSDHVAEVIIKIKSEDLPNCDARMDEQEQENE